MKFTILSHAGLLVEHAGARLVCDPWLLGSCYWRSWWNFPEPDPELIADLGADFIYLTHLHWDHFHGPSLKRLFRRKDLRARAQGANSENGGRPPLSRVPRRRGDPTRRLVRTRRRIFSCAPISSGWGWTAASCSRAAAPRSFNCNDAKFFGLPLQTDSRATSRASTSCLRSHSSAGPIPYCVENYERLPPRRCWRKAIPPTSLSAARSTSGRAMRFRSRAITAFCTGRPSDSTAPPRHPKKSAGTIGRSPPASPVGRSAS